MTKIANEMFTNIQLKEKKTKDFFSFLNRQEMLMNKGSVKGKRGYVKKQERKKKINKILQVKRRCKRSENLKK